jgi:hypothetical protein
MRNARLNFPNRVLPGDSHCYNSNEAANRPLTDCCAVLARREDPSFIPIGPLLCTGEGAGSTYNALLTTSGTV